MRCGGIRFAVWANDNEQAGSQAAACRLQAAPSSCPMGTGGRSHSQVTLSPLAAWQMRYLASTPGQAARGDGLHWRTMASSLALVLMWMGTASEAARDGGGGCVCKKNGAAFREPPFLQLNQARMLRVSIRTVAGVVVLQGEGGPAPCQGPAVHGEAVTCRRFQCSWGRNQGCRLNPRQDPAPGEGDRWGARGAPLPLSTWMLLAEKSRRMQTPRFRAPGSGCCSKQ